MVTVWHHVTRVHFTLLQRVFQVEAGVSSPALFALSYGHVALGQEDVSEYICPSTRYAKKITGSIGRKASNIPTHHKYHGQKNPKEK